MEARYSSIISNADLKSYYRLGDLTDYKGLIDLTNTNSVTFSSAKYGNGADLGSSNSNKYLSAASSLGISGTLSIGHWVYVNTQPSAGEEQFISGISFATGDIYYFIRYRNDGGTYKLDFGRDRNGIAATVATRDGQLSSGTWYHVVLTYDGTNLRGYLDNSLVAGPTSATGTGNDGLNDTIFMGTKLPDGPEKYASVKIDDAVFMNAVMSAQEMTELAVYGNPGGSFIFNLI